MSNMKDENKLLKAEEIAPVWKNSFETSPHRLFIKDTIVSIYNILPNVSHYDLEYITTTTYGSISIIDRIPIVHRESYPLQKINDMTIMMFIDPSLRGCIPPNRKSNRSHINKIIIIQIRLGDYFFHHISLKSIILFQFFYKNRMITLSY